MPIVNGGGNPSGIPQLKTINNESLEGSGNISLAKTDITNVNVGSENSGKYLKVNSDGTIQFDTPQSGGKDYKLYTGAITGLATITSTPATSSTKGKMEINIPESFIIEAIIVYGSNSVYSWQYIIPQGDYIVQETRNGYTPSLHLVYNEINNPYSQYPSLDFGANQFGMILKVKSNNATQLTSLTLNVGSSSTVQYYYRLYSRQ